VEQQNLTLHRHAGSFNKQAATAHSMCPHSVAPRQPASLLDCGSIALQSMTCKGIQIVTIMPAGFSVLEVWITPHTINWQVAGQLWL
jgi:hypothetical protein